ncbi:hypothetical protein DZS_30590 [Dickeya ananatis]
MAGAGITTIPCRQALLTPSVGMDKKQCRATRYRQDERDEHRAGSLSVKHSSNIGYTSRTDHLTGTITRNTQFWSYASVW